MPWLYVGKHIFPVLFLSFRKDQLQPVIATSNLFATCFCDGRNWGSLYRCHCVRLVALFELLLPLLLPVNGPVAVAGLDLCCFWNNTILRSQLHYISPNLGGGGTASPSAFTSVFAYIGSPPQLRRQSRLSWRQGPLYLLEDIVSSSVISSIYHLGPTYVGSLQAPLSGE